MFPGVIIQEACRSCFMDFCTCHQDFNSLLFCSNFNCMKRALFLLFLGCSLCGGSQDLSKELRELDTLFAHDDLNNARILAEKIYPRANTIKNDTVLIEFLNTCGSIFYHLEDYNKAIVFFAEGAEKAKASLGENEYHYALALFNQGGCLKELGRYAEAEPLYLKSLPVLAVAFGQGSLEYTRCFYTLASLYLETSRLQEAESMCAAAVNFYKVNPGQTSDDYLGALGTMAVIYQGQSRYDKAEEIFLSLKNYYSSLSSPPKATLQTLENNLGELYRHMGEYDKAEPFLTRAVQMAGNTLSAAYSLNNLGLVQKAKGAYSEAEASYKQALAIYKQLGKTTHPDYTNPLNNLGELYRTMGRYQDAVYAFEEVIELRKKTLGTNHPNYANALNNLALVEFTLGMYAEAERDLLECKTIYKNILGEKDKFYANCLNNLASVYKASGKLGKAEETYKECLEIYKAGYGDKTDKYAIYLGGLAGTYRMMKKYDKAIPLTLQSLSLLKEKLGVHHYDYIETKYNLAETYREAGQFKEAEELYLQSMEGYLYLIEKYFPFLSEKDKTSFYYNVANAFETYNSFVIRVGQLFPSADHAALIQRMYDNQVALKSLLLKESEKIRTAVAKSNDPGLLADYKQWLQLREFIVQQYRLSSEELELKGINPVGLEQQANNLEQKISIALNINNPHDKKISWTDIRDGLKPGEVSIEMIRTDFYDDARWTDTVYYTALILETGIKSPRMVVIGGNKLEGADINGYRKALRTKTTDDISYTAFWEPLKKFTAGAKRIYFSPDGVYQQLNLYTLKNPSTQQYLLDEADIRLVTNTKDILQQQPTSSNKTAVIFSYPDFGNKQKVPVSDSTRVPGFPDLFELPGTLAEGDSVRNILKAKLWKVEERIKKLATEEEMKKISRPAVLHIATHGFFLKNVKDNSARTMGMQSEAVRQNPLLRSGVILAGAAAVASNFENAAGRDDGILTAYEAAGLDLTGTDMVVLSACETGLGEIFNSQGVYGLQRAFLIAGSRSVVMSLWKIDDQATQQLMVQFYREWLKDPGGSKQNALRQAQFKLRERFPQPYYWGAFILVGD